MIELKGPWKKGFVFDVHTLKSVCIGHNQWGHPEFETIYSEMGRQVYALKYKQDIAAIENIISLLVKQIDFVKFVKNIEVILPVPPSNRGRKMQPAILVAQKLAEVFMKDFRIDVLDSINTEQIKNIDSKEKYDKVKNL